MRSRRALLGSVCAGALALAVLSAPVRAAAPEPDFIVTPNALAGPVFQDPCGIAVASTGRLYVASYYRNSIDTIEPSPTPTPLVPLISEVDSLSGPCALGLDSMGRVYVNSYHRNVEKFIPVSFPPSSATPHTSAGIFSSATPTGLAVNQVTGGVYVTARDHIAAYDSSGTLLQTIGAGSLADGYGLAVSLFPATAGRLYVADHADDTVKVYDPNVDLDDPVEAIAGPPAGFRSLRDSAIAVDRVSGDVYVADTLGPQYSERSRAVIYVFDSAGAYKGRLKYDIVDSSPPGLAVDNTIKATQGRVYVASGNSMVAGAIYVYPPGSATSQGASATFSLRVRADGDGSGTVSSQPRGVDCEAPCEGEFLARSELTLSAVPEAGSTFVGWSGAGCSGAGPCTVTMDQAKVVGAVFERRAGSVGSKDSPLGPGASRSGSHRASQSVIAQKGTLRVQVEGKMAPNRLPRSGTAPISVTVGGEITTTDKSVPPQLERIQIELNRGGRIDTVGLPPCDYDAIQPGSSERALAACGDSLVGKGSFTANITLAGQEPYPTGGKLLLFHSVEKGKPVLYGHIYSPKPFATSFVIVFKVQRISKGKYGIALNAPLPPAMDAWGRLTGLQMNLSRRYSHKGKAHSFLSAGCPAPKGFTAAQFPLARTEFAFEGGKKLRSTLMSQCRVRG